MKIKICGIDYEVCYRTNEEMSGHLGLADFNGQKISINSNHTKQTQEIALIHEILHIVSDSYGLNLSEHQVKILTHGLISVYKDNSNIFHDFN